MKEKTPNQTCPKTKNSQGDYPWQTQARPMHKNLGISQFPKVRPKMLHT